MANYEEKNIPASNVDAEEDQTVKIVRPKKPRDAKVVLETGTDSAVRPSDSTTMEPSPLASSDGAPKLVAVSQPTSVDETVDDQTTKIPSMKPPPKPQGVQLRTASDAPVPPPPADESAEETIEMDRGDVDLPPITAESGLAKPKPQAAPAVPPAAPAAPAAPAVQAGDAGTPKKAKTIKLTPLGTGSEEDDSVEETLSLDRSVMEEGMPSALGGASKPPAAPATPPPTPAAPAAPPSAAAPAAPPAVPKPPAKEEESTVKLAKTPKAPPKAIAPKKEGAVKVGGAPKAPAAPKPPASEQTTPSVPGAKETINLRPSAATPPPSPQKAPAKPAAASTIKVQPPPKPEATAKPPGAVSKNTIRLAPKPKSEAASSAKPAPVKPSSPTVKLPDESEDTGKNSKKTLKLSRAGTGAPPSSPSPSPGKTDSAASTPASTPASTAAEPEEDKSSEPGVVLTLVACVTFLLLVYLGLLIGGQWAHNEQDAQFDYQYIFLKDVVLKPGQAPPR